MIASRPRASRHRRGALVVAIGLAVAGCDRQPPLAHTHASPAALARDVLDALARHDRAALDALAIDESEFRAHVWPSLPAARPERNLPMSYVWGDLHQKSQASLARTLAAHGGQRFELLSVRFGEPPTTYASYAVHRDTRLVVRTAAGAERELRVCGSLLEQNGRWKVFSYVVDD